MRPKPLQPAKVIAFRDDQLTDQELVNGLRRRDAHAAHALYARHGERINRLVWRMLGADVEHDDVVQQVFVNILDSIHGLRDPAALGAWLTGVTTNTVRRELRARKYRRWLHPALATDLECVGRDVSGRAVVVRRVYELLRALKTRHQIALTLRYVEGMTLGELAAACGCSLATIKRRLAKARKVFMKRAGRDAVVAAWLEEACLGE